MSKENRCQRSFTLPTIFSFILMMVVVQSGFAQSNNDAYLIETFDVTDNVSLEVQTSGGSIKVIGSEENEVIVEIYVRHNGKYLATNEVDRDRFELNTSQSGNSIKAHAKTHNEGWGWNLNNYSISFVVYAPNNTRTRLKTSGGRLTVKNLTGTQELRTSGGSITTEGIVGEMVLKTSGGSININDVQGDVEGRTSGGPIKIKSVNGSLNMRTSGGSITIENVEGNVSARTSGGSIKAEVLAPKDHIELRTSGGSITITVPREYGYDLDLDGSMVITELNNFNGKSERDEIKGTMNGGGTQINARTSGGFVTLKFFK